MQCVWELYPQIVLAIGLHSQDNVISLYAGSDEAAALAAIDAAGKAGTINLGFVYENPPASVVLRFGPGMGGAESRARYQRGMPQDTKVGFLFLNLI